MKPNWKIFNGVGLEPTGGTEKPFHGLALVLEPFNIGSIFAMAAYFDG